jgi:hypothetical protein
LKKGALKKDVPSVLQALNDLIDNLAPLDRNRVALRENIGAGI